MDENVIRAEIEQGLAQVDSTLTITDFLCQHDTKTRTITVHFTAKSESGETVEVSTKWA